MEQIYTIPINEAFEASIKEPELGCPFCRLYEKLEENELDLALGASMMEPEIRQKMNEKGFCAEHYKKMFSHGKNKLPLALILESHLQTVGEQIKISKFLPARKGSKTAKKLEKLSATCYICEKLDANFARVLDNAANLWANDAEFRQKCSKQPYICIEHYGMFMSAAQTLSKKEFAELYRCLSPIEEKHLQALKQSISAFIKQFDYRYEGTGEDRTKDAIENAISSLTGEKFK